MPLLAARSLTAAGLIAISTSQAYVSAPTKRQIAAAVEKGRALAKSHEGYYAADYLIYKSSDTLALDPAGDNIDAVVLGTPLERTRHASFLKSYSQKSDAVHDPQSTAGLPDGWLQLVVFAHGAGRRDRDFFKRFGPAVLQVGSNVLMPVSVEYEGPERAIYPHAAHDTVRYSARIAYKFNLGVAPNIGWQAVVFSFSDATDKHFNLPIDLARYD